MTHSIEVTLAEIKKASGLQLVPCDYFKGIQTHNNKNYFNVILKDRVSESSVYSRLLNLIKYGLISSVEPNGLNRLAIYF